MRHLFLILVLLLSLSAPLQAKQRSVTGEALLAFCQSESQIAQARCQSYITGVVDYHLLIKGLGTAPTVDFCLPAEITAEKIKDIVTDYLMSNAQHSSFVASPAVAMALYQAYPCQ